jgi:hypothetical protein
MTRSSTVLIRDTLTTGDRVHKLWNYFTDAPPEYAQLTCEFHALYLAVSDLVSQTARIQMLIEHDEAAKGKQLRAICDSVATTLADVERFIKKNKPAEDKTEQAENGRKGSKGGPARTNRKWRRFEAASNIYDLLRLKQILIMNCAALMDFRSSLTAAAQDRLEPASERQDFLAMAIFELMAGAVTVDEDGEGSRISSQTPTPVDQEKVMAIWQEYGVSAELSRTYQREIDGHLEKLSNSSRLGKKSKDDGELSASEKSSPKSKSTKQVATQPQDLSQHSPRKPVSILFDDRTQSHVGVLFAHHLRRLLSPTTHEPYTSTILNLELCSPNSPPTHLSRSQDAKLAAAFLKHTQLTPWRRSLYRPRRSTDPYTFDIIIVAGYGPTTIPPHYSRSIPDTAQGAQKVPTAELLCFEDLAALSGRKFSNPLSRSLMSISGKGAWERAEKEVIRGVGAFMQANGLGLVGTKKGM